MKLPGRLRTVRKGSTKEGAEEGLQLGEAEYIAIDNLPAIFVLAEQIVFAARRAILEVVTCKVLQKISPRVRPGQLRSAENVQK